jgi:hypothetical protein
MRSEAPQRERRGAQHQSQLPVSRFQPVPVAPCQSQSANLCLWVATRLGLRRSPQPVASDIDGMYPMCNFEPHRTRRPRHRSRLSRQIPDSIQAPFLLGQGQFQSIFRLSRAPRRRYGPASSSQSALLGWAPRRIARPTWLRLSFALNRVSSVLSTT